VNKAIVFVSIIGLATACRSPKGSRVRDDRYIVTSHDAQKNLWFIERTEKLPSGIQKKQWVLRCGGFQLAGHDWLYGSNHCELPVGGRFESFDGFVRRNKDGLPQPIDTRGYVVEIPGQLEFYTAPGAPYASTQMFEAVSETLK
jgi:hypothetical protein